MDKLAIVILNWNGAEMLKKYLPSVLNFSREEAVVYVADNASTDNSIALLKEQFPEVRLILLEKNWGFAEGYNKALAQVEAEYYLLLNSDIEVTPGWLIPMIEFMDAHKEVAACQPKLLSIFQRDSFEYAGACGGYMDRYGYPFCRGRIFDVVEQDKGQYDEPAKIHWATGAALLVRARIYKEVGGLDGRFFAHQEEIEMCWRMRIRGYQIWCLPQSKVYHVGGGTLPKSNPMKTYLNFRNNLTMLYKCLPEKDLKPVMRLRWFLDYLAAFQTLLLKRNIGDFKAIFRARRDFKRWRKDFVKDRQQIQNSRKDNQESEFVPFLLLWKYYAKGCKTFSQLGW
ncbi:glycosyltransferase family 2 protein [Prevotella sp. E2-28]|uniref:glycosyltransferase family 2 protein n=1 Tax=Prevotella sp. E2-28 TaxID=2913620 RepID=UPI001EDB9D74|nr:glycosyltransferase family 2 protein [Prevotella sp. E2-28]UKK52754.1 glycosyltransferase family 2 protein [Prevotella sp. E2-28]